MFLERKRIKNVPNLLETAQKCPPSTYWVKNAFNVLEMAQKYCPSTYWNKFSPKVIFTLKNWPLINDTIIWNLIKYVDLFIGPIKFELAYIAMSFLSTMLRIAELLISSLMFTKKVYIVYISHSVLES